MLDLARLNDLRSEVGEDEFAEVVDIFREEVEDVLGRLDGVDPLDLAGALHFLKGSALNIGLQQVGALCESEERRLKADPNHAPDVAEIRSCYDVSVIELANFAG